MVTVAIAGATGHIGKAILDVLKKNQAHKVIALSASHDTHTVVVDYNNIDSVADVLESNGVHTVISAILVKDAESSASEIHLVRAASKSRPTKRFVASDYAAPIPEE
ncbi:putative nmra-like family protein [Ilyonectria robusta]